jgi:hypothetical protein
LTYRLIAVSLQVSSYQEQLSLPQINHHVYEQWTLEVAIRIHILMATSRGDCRRIVLYNWPPTTILKTRPISKTYSNISHNHWATSVWGLLTTISAKLCHMSISRGLVCYINIIIRFNCHLWQYLSHIVAWSLHYVY